MNRKYILGIIGWLFGGAIMTYFFLAPTVKEGGRFSADVHFVGLLVGGLIVTGASMLIHRKRS